MRLGTDPELFLVKGTNYVSAVGVIPGTKEEPVTIPGMPPGFTMQHDNVALELGIPPAASAEEFSLFIHQALVGVKPVHKGLSHAKTSLADFPKSELNTAEAQHFGCDPDFSAWTGKENPKPVPPKPTIRSAGGHIHVETKLPKEAVIRGMDLFISVPALLIDVGGADRRKFYGRPGAYRPKPYGVEYRTPSNFWIFRATLREWVWNQTAIVLRQVMSGKKFTDERILKTLENEDVDAAVALIAEYGVKMP